MGRKAGPNRNGVLGLGGYPPSLGVSADPIRASQHSCRRRCMQKCRRRRHTTHNLTRADSSECDALARLRPCDGCSREFISTGANRHESTCDLRLHKKWTRPRSTGACNSCRMLRKVRRAFAPAPHNLAQSRQRACAISHVLPHSHRSQSCANSLCVARPFKPCGNSSQSVQPPWQSLVSGKHRFFSSSGLWGLRR